MRPSTRTMIAAIAATVLVAADPGKDFDQVVQRMDAWNAANPSFCVTVATAANGEAVGTTNLVRSRNHLLAQIVGVMGTGVDVLMSYDSAGRRACISSNRIAYWARMDERTLLASASLQGSDPLAPFDLRALKPSVKAVAEVDGGSELLFFIPKATALLGGNRDNPQKPVAAPADATTIVVTVAADGFLRRVETVIGVVRSTADFVLRSRDDAEVARLAPAEPDYAVMRQDEPNIFMNDMAKLLASRNREK